MENKFCSYCLVNFTECWDYCIFLDQELEEFYLCSQCFGEIDQNRMSK